MNDEKINEATACLMCDKPSERIGEDGLCWWCAEDQARAKNEAILCGPQ